MDSSAPSPTFVLWLQGLIQHVQRQAELFVSGRFWLLKILLTATVFSLSFVSCPDLGLLPSGASRPPLENKRQSILLHLTAGQALNVPAPESPSTGSPPRGKAGLRVLREMGPTGLAPAPWTYAATELVLGLACLLAWQVTHDRLCALWVTLTTALSYNGAFGTVLFSDSLAMGLMLWAILPSTGWWMRGLLAFAAGCSSPAAFLAAPLLTAGLALSGPSSRLPRRHTFAPVTGLLLALLGQGALLWPRIDFALALSEFWRLFQSHVLDYRSGIWFTLQGGWLVVGAALVSVWHQRLPWRAGAFLLSICLLIGGSFGTWDFVCSLSYALPAAFLALFSLAKAEPLKMVRRCCLSAFLATLVGGDFHRLLPLHDNQPALVQLLCHLLEQMRSQ